MDDNSLSKVIDKAIQYIVDIVYLVLVNEKK